MGGSRALIGLAAWVNRGHALPDVRRGDSVSSHPVPMIAVVQWVV